MGESRIQDSQLTIAVAGTRLSVSIGQHSVAGRKDSNEDFYGVIIPNEPLLTTKGVAAAIADGMSGSEAGAQASQSSIRCFLDDYYSTPETWSVKKSAGKVITALNRWLYGMGHELHGTHKGLVTTLSCLVIKSNTAHLFHVGDSRIYRLRSRELERLTTDHRVRAPGDREYLSRAMGIDIHVEIDYRALPLEQGDVFVFTTDGVHDFVADQALIAHLARGTGLDETTRRITQEAYAAGSHDNLSCQVLRVDTLPDADEHEFYNRLTEMPFPPELAPGMVLDGYRILRELHATKHIQVYLALDTESGQRVVLKTPSVNYSDDPHYIDLFVHEEWIGKRINNPHVMKVCGESRKRQFLYYVAEYLEGQTLRQWMNDHPTPSLSEVRRTVNQIASGLRAFHRLDMVHQDIKPENIMIDDHGTAKIIDLGSTKVGGLEDIAIPLDRDILVGTLDYAAPEYFRGQPGTNRSDIYSLGVIAYEMLTGALPYGRALSERNLRRVRYCPAVRVSPSVPAWVDAVLKKAVHLDPVRRYGLLSEFTYDLEHPNPSLAQAPARPLLERNPVAFWKGFSLILLLTNILMLYYFSR
jgi:serine/threonine protein phosphatase PrpC